MKLIYGFDNLPKLNAPVITIGSFDGVHSAHRQLLAEVASKARGEGKDSVVLSFNPHPRAVLETESQRVKLLNTLDEKIFLLEQIRIDYLLIVPFTIEFSRLSSEVFLRDYLLAKLGVSCMVVGFNHHFGHNKAGNYQTLVQTSNIEILCVDKQLVKEQKVSSTLIRNYINEGCISQANECLTQPYFILTNSSMSVDENKLLPPSGEYPVRVKCAGDVFDDKLIVENSTISLAKVKNLDSGSDFLIEFL